MAIYSGLVPQGGGGRASHYDDTSVKQSISDLNSSLGNIDNLKLTKRNPIGFRRWVVHIMSAFNHKRQIV